MEEPSIKPGELVVPGPEDPFRADGKNTDLNAGEFWRWMLGDLRMNTTRGFLAEYLVSRAVGNEDPMRTEWASFDVLAADGTRIEMKASGYAQSWPGKKAEVSNSFGSVDKKKMWDEHQGTDVDVDPDDRVDVWVFALQRTPRDASIYDPMDLDEWLFRAVPHAWLRTCGQRQGGPPFFDKHGFEAVDWTGLPAAVKEARRHHERLVGRGSG